MGSLIGGLLGGGNILGSLLNLASMAFPALQMASSLFNMVGQALGGAVKAGVDQLMQESGLPKFIGDALKGLVDEVFGANQQQTTAGADQAVQQQFGDQAQASQVNWASMFAQAAQQGKAEQDEAAGGNSGKGGWLVALAKAFGKIANDAATDLKKMGENLSNENPSEMIEYQAKSQEFSQMMNTFTNAIKTIGEAEASTVRKG